MNISLYKKIGILLLGASLLASCSNVKTPKEPVTKVNPSTSASTSPAPVPSPTITFNETVQESPLATNLLTSTELKDYVVVKRSKKDRTPEQITLDDSYNQCLGADAPKIAYVGNTDQIEGDRFDKTFKTTSHLTFESIVVSSSTAKADIDYLAESKTHSDCLENYINSVIFSNSANIDKATATPANAKSGANPNIVKYSLVSFKDGILLTKLHTDPTTTTPGITILIATIAKDDTLIQYVANVSGQDKAENKLAADYASKQLPIWLSSKK